MRASGVFLLAATALSVCHGLTQEEECAGYTREQCGRVSYCRMVKFGTQAEATCHAWTNSDRSKYCSLQKTGSRCTALRGECLWIANEARCYPVFDLEEWQKEMTVERSSSGARQETTTTTGNGDAMNETGSKSRNEAASGNQGPSHELIAGNEQASNETAPDEQKLSDERALKEAECAGYTREQCGRVSYCRMVKFGTQAEATCHAWTNSDRSKYCSLQKTGSRCTALRGECLWIANEARCYPVFDLETVRVETRQREVTMPVESGSSGARHETGSESLRDRLERVRRELAMLRRERRAEFERRRRGSSATGRYGR